MPDQATIHFDSLLAQTTTYDPHLHMPRHTDKLNRISITIKGGSDEKTDLQSAHIGCSSLLTKPNDAFHETTFGKQGATILSIQFKDPDLMPASCRQWANYPHPSLSVAGVKLWAALKKVRSDKELYAILNQLERWVTGLQSVQAGNEVLQQAARQLAGSCQEKNSMQQLARDHHLHRVYFSRAFKRTHGISPLQYLQQSRLLKALEFLSHGKESLAAVAFNAGYADQSHMSRAIKQAFGCSPAQMQKAMQEKQGI